MLLLNRIKVIEILHSNKAVSYQDGELVFKKIKELSAPDTKVEVYFSEIKFATAAFLTALIGRLLIFFPGKKFKSYVHFIEVDGQIKPLIDMVISRSKEYSNDPKGFKELAEKALNEP